jgi:hypothetical protein
MIEKHLKNLEPIEIPSDEDMVAKFMRDKIQGGNK